MTNHNVECTAHIVTPGYHAKPGWARPGEVVTRSYCLIPAFPLGEGGASDPAELDDDVSQLVAAGTVRRSRQLGARAPPGGQLLKQAFFYGLGGAACALTPR